MATKIILDVDTGADGAVALMTVVIAHADRGQDLIRGPIGPWIPIEFFGEAVRPEPAMRPERRTGLDTIGQPDLERLHAAHHDGAV